MHIDLYSFGHIVIDGRSYSNDVIIADGKVQPDWWRKQGHRLSIADLETVIEAGPAVLIIGCGSSGMMKVPPETIEALQAANIEPEIYNTAEAVERFNKLAEQGSDVAAGFHLTC